MACGTPVVAFGVGGVPDMIEHQIDGYVAEPENIEDLQNGLYELISDEQKRKKFAENGRKKVVEKYSYPVVAKKMIDIYQRVLNNKG